jgi:hypothetical protein
MQSDLCDAACLSALESVDVTTTASGLQYKDITVGTGAMPKVGYQVCKATWIRFAVGLAL